MEGKEVGEILTALSDRQHRTQRIITIKHEKIYCIQNVDNSFNTLYMKQIPLNNLTSKSTLRQGSNLI